MIFPSYIVEKEIILPKSVLEKELIQKLKEFQKIKPSKDWVDFVFFKITSLKSSPKVVISPKVKLIKHLYLFPQYKTAFASLIVFFVLLSSISFAKNSLPGSPFYPLKILMQDTRIALASSKEKPLVKLEVAKERLNDLSKVKKPNEKIVELANKLKNEINSVPEEIKKIEKKQLVLNLSEKVKEKNEELKNIIEKSSLNKETKEDLNSVISESQNKVLSLITETSEFINNCPTYLEEKINNLKDYFFNNENLTTWTPEEIIKVRALLIETEKFMKAGNCLEAIEKIESIEKIMKIHSLENIKLEVDNSIPENKDFSATNVAE